MCVASHISNEQDSTSQICSNNKFEQLKLIVIESLSLLSQYSRKQTPTTLSSKSVCFTRELLGVLKAFQIGT